jgi:hypothetical protein
MLLYHGSKRKLDKLTPQQAGAGEGVVVPKDELKKAIYFTPNREFAIACAARPDGLSKIDDENKKIEFEKPHLYDPNMDIYIYCIDTDKISQENLQPVKDDGGEIDENQFAVVNMEELTPDSRECLKASEVEKYYELTNWKPKEVSESENKNGFKIK